MAPRRLCIMAAICGSGCVMARRLVVEGSKLAQAPPPRSTPGLAAPGAGEGSEGLLGVAGGVGDECVYAPQPSGDFLAPNFFESMLAGSRARGGPAENHEDSLSRRKLHQLDTETHTTLVPRAPQPPARHKSHLHAGSVALSLQTWRQSAYLLHRYAARHTKPRKKTTRLKT